MESGPDSSGRRAGRARRAGRLLRALTVMLVYGTLFVVAAFAGLVVATLPELPKIERSGAFHHVEGKVLARDGRTVLRTLRAPTTRRYTRVGDVPDVLANAVVATEDRRFYEHRGIDVRGIARAALVDLRAREIREGGSTITQQLVKNAYVGPRRTLARKSREALLALALDARWSKRRILTAYLNTAYFGEGAYGVRDAARTYFGAGVGDLDLAQAAMLAALLRAPTADDPLVAPERARARRHEVLDAMLEAGFIDERRRRHADAAPLPTASGVRMRGAAAGELAPHLTDAVVGDVMREMGVARTLGGGLRVVTTLDPAMQRSARRAVGQIEGTGPSAALVAIDPRSGEVRALAIGGPAAERAFNVAIDGARQPGSAFKPFTLAAAFEHGYVPSTPVLSAPFTRSYGSPIGTWKVTNGSGLYAGLQPLEQATWFSDNTVFARVADDVGIEEVIATARDAGIDARVEPLPSAALGALSTGVSPAGMASAYATFAEHGMHAGASGGQPLLVRRVTDASGHVLVRHASVRRRALARIQADLVTSVLVGVIDHGTGTRAQIGRPAAGKTGTTDDNVDAWFVGYTPTLVAAVWVGYPQGARAMRSEYHGEEVAGGTFPAEIWAAFMREAAPRRTRRQVDFHLAEPSYVTVMVDAATRLLADEWCARARRERFLRGLEPTRSTADCPERTRPAPNVTGLEQGKAEAMLRRSGFAFEVREVSSAAGAAGTVVAQVPPAGGPVTRDRGMRLLVAAERDGRE